MLSRTRASRFPLLSALVAVSVAISVPVALGNGAFPVGSGARAAECARLFGEVRFVDVEAGLLWVADPDGRMWVVSVPATAGLAWNGARVASIAVFTPLGQGAWQDVAICLERGVDLARSGQTWRATRVEGRMAVVYGFVVGVSADAITFAPLRGAPGDTDEAFAGRPPAELPVKPGRPDILAVAAEAMTTGSETIVVFGWEGEVKLVVLS